jgi:uncharacterized SAM-binding protein YcdF (DUF218 family)
MTKQEMTDYIFLDDKNPKGDIALVFGTWNAWQGSIEKAAELYTKKLVPKIIVSGGVNPKTKEIEGDKMAKELIALDIPKEDILIENKSTNTLENVLFSLDVIDRKIGLKNIHTIVGVVKNYHARRALMTMRKNIPAQIALKAAAYNSPYYNFTKENWTMSEMGREKVLEEIDKIKIYLAKGHLAEL